MQDNNDKIKILSLNGGGVRGLFTISVLAEIERIIEDKTGASNVKVGDYFDLITGTSIGGIMALGLAYGKSARELETIFKEKASLIFPKRNRYFSYLKLPFTALYSSKPLRDTVVSMIGESVTFNDLERRVMIPAVNLSTGKPQFFKTPHNPQFNRDGRLKLIDAAMATSAAPTYFSPHYCTDLSSYFADGGLVANNPSFIGLLEVLLDMRTDFADATTEDVHILNIGTLGEEYTVSPSSLEAKDSWWKGGYLGLWGTGKRLVLATMAANQVLHRNMLIRELKTADRSANYIYLDATVPNEAASDITLDNASDSSLKNLASRGRQLATEQFTINTNLQEFFKTPAKPFIRRSQ